MNRLKSVLCLLLAFMFVCWMAACDALPQQSTLSSSESEPEPTPDVESEPESSLPESSEESEPSSEVEESSSESEPASVPADSFDEIFDGNPLDTALEDELAEASSNHAILQAYENSESRWKSFIQLTYNDGKSQLTGEDLERLQQEQESWEESIDIVVEGIRADAGDDSDGRLTAARMVQERYRVWGKSLAQVIYDATGELPDFEKAWSGEAMG